MRGPARVLLAALLAVVAAGCGAGERGPLAPEVWTAREAQLEEARARWEAQGILAYRFTSVTSCECAAGFTGPVAVEVDRGVVVGVTPVDASIVVTAEEWPMFRTVADLFGLVGYAIQERAAHFDVAYDPVLGYPTRIGLDIHPEMVDDEVGVHVTELTILEREP